MTSIKRIADLRQYTSVLPYASELFGVYQPLLGWRSARIRDRYRQGFNKDREALLRRLARQFSGVAKAVYREGDKVAIGVSLGTLRTGALRQFDSLVLERIGSLLPPHETHTADMWAKVITPKIVGAILAQDVPQFYAQAYADLGDSKSRLAALLRRNLRDPTAVKQTALSAQLARESRTAEMLLFLAGEGNHRALEDIFYVTTDDGVEARRIARMLAEEDSFSAVLGIETLDPGDAEHLKAVALSPIGVVHLFRQYFFELDTFLGPPQGHVWLSPGSSVELIETHTRRSVTERTLSTVLETNFRSEKSMTMRDEISEAVKEDNDRTIAFGAGVKASYGSIEATASFDLSNSQKTAREVTHKRMREQTDKLSTEIRRNVTSTFRMLTELTDTSSTKHVLANVTKDLINYELRRKMRQVGIQVQDIGTFLCWQTYVDDPGRTLGLAELIHIAAPPQLDALTHPEAIPPLEPFQEPKTVTIPFVSLKDSGADNKGEVYVDGTEVNNTERGGSLEKIVFEFEQRFVCPRANYELANVEFDPQGKQIEVSLA